MLTGWLSCGTRVLTERLRDAHIERYGDELSGDEDSDTHLSDFESEEWGTGPSRRGSLAQSSGGTLLARAFSSRNGMSGPASMFRNGSNVSSALDHDLGHRFMQQNGVGAGKGKGRSKRSFFAARAAAPSWADMQLDTASDYHGAASPVLGNLGIGGANGHSAGYSHSPVLPSSGFTSSRSRGAGVGGLSALETGSDEQLQDQQRAAMDRRGWQNDWTDGNQARRSSVLGAA